MQNRPKISAKAYLLIWILLTSNLGAFAQRPPTSGPNPEDEDNLIPYIIGGSGLVLGAGSYFYLKGRGPKIAVTEHLPSYLLSRNILPTPDAINLMHELNPRLSKKNIMRANKKLVNPEFPEISPTLNTAGAVQVTILNRGNADAAIFKMSINYIGPDTPDDGFVVAFSVPGQDDKYYPWTQNVLAPGSEVSFTGTLIFHPSLHGITVSVYAVADSCSGDEFVPDECRVLESNEENNKSSAISINLP